MSFQYGRGPFDPRKETDAKALDAPSNGSGTGPRSLDALNRGSHARKGSPLATQDGNNGGTPSPVSKDVHVGGGGTGSQIAPSDPGGQTSGRTSHSSPAESTADVSAEHAYHQWQEHFWGARERTFNRLGIRER